MKKPLLYRYIMLIDVTKSRNVELIAKLGQKLGFKKVGFWGINLERIDIICNFAVALEMQQRAWAAAQHSSSELGSAFTLHHPCNMLRRCYARNIGRARKN